ncbi:hypothetical protein C8J56DRAFT_161586 [Mycena floridula]|nr:hypothetical protein C8J56DRAFT_161586 [Mycena floridula]
MAQDDSSDIAQLLEQKQAECFELRSEIHELQSRLEDRFLRLVAAEHAVQKCRGQISAFRKFPTELLSEVFLFSVADEGQSDLGSAPLFLCWVCREWRSVAMDDARLWRQISYGTSTWLKKGVVELLKLWLANSVSMPLEISVIWPSQDDARFQTILTELVRNLGRWRSFSFSAEEFEDFNWILPRVGLADASPQLVSLSMTFTEYSHRMQNNWFASIAATTRNLESLRWQDDFWMLRKLCLGKLRYLEAGTAQLSDLVILLQHLPHLEHLKLGYLRSDKIVFTPALHVIHHSVQVLHIVFSNDATSVLELFLSSLTLPSLVDLTLRNVPWPPSAVESLIQRSSCRLVTISIPSKWVAPEITISCLKMCNSLVHLSLGEGEDTVIPNSIFEFLLEPTTLPNLQTISFTFDVDTQTVLFHQFIAARLKMLEKRQDDRESDDDTFPVLKTMRAAANYQTTLVQMSAISAMIDEAKMAGVDLQVETLWTF